MNKTINYVWLGPNPKPKIFEICLESWKRYLPDYEIIEWNESKFDVINHPYVSMLYKNKCYSHASDYIRAWVLQETSGFYFDIDLLILKPIDFLLKYDAVYSFMTNSLINNAFSGAVKNHPTVIDYLNYFDGKVDELKSKDITIQMLNTELHGPDNLKRILFTDYGVTVSDKRQSITHNGIILPESYIYSTVDDFDLTSKRYSNCYGVHLCECSWIQHIKHLKHSNK